MPKTRNIIDRMRRPMRPPYDPVMHPDVMPDLRNVKPGSPPSTQRFAVTTFDSRPEVVNDFHTRVGGVEVTRDDGGTSIFYTMIAPSGFNLLVRAIAVAAAINYNELDSGAPLPLTRAANPFLNAPQAPQAIIQVNDTIVADVSQSDGSPVRMDEILWGTWRVDLFLRLKAGDTLSLEARQSGPPVPAESIFNLRPQSFAYFTGNIIASDNCETQEIGLTRRPVPTIDMAEGTLL